MLAFVDCCATIRHQQPNGVSKMTNTISIHRELQLFNLMDSCEADARLNFRCAKRANSINNRSAAAFFFARATKALRVAYRAGIKAGV